MAGKNPIHIGTSGWSYAHWKGVFYPQGAAPDRFLAYYAQKFRTVELNNTFYQLPSEDAVKLWRETTGQDFIFAVKASRYLTHMKKLKDPEEGFEKFIRSVEPLGAKLGPILFQLPPRWRVNVERFADFIGILPPTFRYAFEFREASWFNPEVYGLMRDNNIAFCIYELAGHASPREVTADVVYARLHGPAGAYQGSYPTQTLAGWAGAFSSWSRQGKEIYCYFDNDQAGYAAQNALQLQEMTAGL